VYPQESAAAEQLARILFSEPNVELASHTFSHPFFWGELEGRSIKREKKYGDNLDVEGYELDLERELNGSVAYINQRLAPNNKRVKVFLWSGDASPGERAMAQLRSLGLYNVNGGNTKVLPFANSMTKVWPIGLRRANGTQIYAPIMNENVYTNEWEGPYFGFRQVVETFKLLESPRRLKPVSLYYHFYSGSKPEALNALFYAYDWAMKQNLIPLYLSEYAARASAFYQGRITRDISDNWRLYSQEPVTTLRLPATAGAIEGVSIAGYAQANDQYYFSFAREQPVVWRQRMDTVKSHFRYPHLNHANVVIDSWRWLQQAPRSSSAIMSYHGWMSPELVFRQANQCDVSYRKQSLHFSGDGQVVMHLPWQTAREVRIDCSR
jgi:hypothetical protein